MKICIDAGHCQPSGSLVDYGARDPYLLRNESENTLIASGILKGKLEKVGVEVVMTRTSNVVPLSWKKRLEICNSDGVDLVISIHNNSFSDAGACGIETLVSRHCKSDSKTLEMADGLHYEMALASGLVNRGLKVANRGLAVLDDTKAPAILVELGFISNRTESALLFNEVWLGRTLDGLVKGICNYYGIKPVVEANKPNVVFRGKELYVPMELVDGKNKVFVSDLKYLGFRVGYEGGKVTLDE